MKRTFIGLQYAPKGTTGGKVENKVETETLQGEQETETLEIDDFADFKDETETETKKDEVVYDSPTLQGINAEIARLYGVLPNVVNNVDKTRFIMAKIYAQEQLKDAEIKAIRLEIAKKEIEAKRSAIVETNRVQGPLYIAQYLANLAFHAIPLDERDKDENKAIKEASIAADKAIKDAQEIVENRLLSGVPSVQGAKIVANVGKEQGNGQGSKTEQIKTLIAPLYVQGKTPAEIRAYIIKEKGFNDGTANAAIHAYECENSLNGKNPAMIGK